MPDSLSNRPHQLLVAPRSCTRFAVRCDIRTDQKIRARDGALFGWQDAPRAPHVSNLIALGVSLRMTIKTVREIGEIPAASQALRRTCEMRRSDLEAAATCRNIQRRRTTAGVVSREKRMCSAYLTVAREPGATQMSLSGIFRQSAKGAP